MLKVKSIYTVYHGIETRSYLLLSGKQGVLIDSGSAQTAKQYINPKLRKLARSHPFTLQFIVNTHSHADHSGGNSLLKSTWHSKILAHQSESRNASSKTSALQAHFAQYARFFPVNTHELNELKQALGPSVKVDRKLRDSSRIEFGNCSLEVMLTPGHSRGSISLYEPEGKLLFLGDNVQGSGVKADFPTLPIYDDVDAYEESLKRLRTLEVTSAFAGHPFLPLRKSRLRAAEFHRLIDASIKALNQLGETITNYARDGLNAPQISRKVMLARGWIQTDLVPVFVLASVEAFLRSRRWSQ